jgi:hypothetical protein
MVAMVALGALGIARGIGTSVAIRPLILLLCGAAGLLLMPSVEISDDAIAVSWAFGLRKRTIPLRKITEITCRFYYPFLHIHVAGEKGCRINFGFYGYNVRVARDIRLRLEHLKSRGLVFRRSAPA